jgi:uncharacterized peroxidase-related enzyme
MTSVAKLNKPVKATATKGSATRATATKGFAAKPTATKPTATKGFATKPTATKPTASKGLATKGLATKPGAAKMPIAKSPPVKVAKADGPVAAPAPLAKQPLAKQPLGKQKPVAGETPRRQDGEPAPTALALPPGDLSPEMRAYLDKCREKIGFVPHVLTSYAHDNVKLAAFAAFYNDLMLGPSGLSKLEREMIAVAVSSENHCIYCLTAHGAAVRQLSGDPVLGELMAMNWRAAKLSHRHRVMLGFASKVTLHSRQINEADRDNLRKAGFSNRDIWDIAAVASFFNMSNRMASAVDMRPNRQYHTQAR